jgi:microcystin-dependent protein
MRALPGVAPSTQNRSSGFSGRLVPEVADRIPDNVLAAPIIGEAWRFDGATAPPGWMLATGQTLTAEQNPHLFALLKKINGGDGKHTFNLPNPKFGVIIAVAGLYPSSPALVAQAGRHLTHGDSLGLGAQRAFGRNPSARAVAAAEKRVAAVREAQRFQQSAIHPRVGGVGRLPAELAGRIEQSRDDARANALGRVTPANRSRALALVDAMLSGRASLHGAQLQMAATLSLDEARALLDVHDAHQAAFRPRWQGMEHPQPQADAGRFMVDVAFTAEQRRTLASRPDNESR